MLVVVVLKIMQCDTMTIYGNTTQSQTLLGGRTIFLGHLQHICLLEQSRFGIQTRKRLMILLYVNTESSVICYADSSGFSLVFVTGFSQYCDRICCFLADNQHVKGRGKSIWGVALKWPTVHNFCCFLSAILRYVVMVEICIQDVF